MFVNREIWVLNNTTFMGVLEKVWSPLCYEHNITYSIQLFFIQMSIVWPVDVKC